MASPAVAEVKAAMEALPRPPPKRMARLPPPIPRPQVPLLLPKHHHTAADGRPPSATSPTRRARVGRKRRRMQARPGRAPATRHATSQMPCQCLYPTSFQ